MYKIFLTLLVLSALPAFALPLTGVSLRLVPSGSDDAVGVAPKIIDVKKNKDGLRVEWFSLVKQEVAGEYFPTYKVKSNRGVLDLDALAGKTGYFHPHLWTQGYTALSASLPLWLPPELLSLTGKKTEPFQPGFLGLAPAVLKAAPDRVYERLLYFQKLYDHFVRDGEVVRDAGLTRQGLKEVRKFVREFFSIGLVAQTKAKLAVNRQVRDVDAKILGNPYLQFVVMDDPQNPLVLSFRVLNENAPEAFRKVFDFLKANFEFQVTQVNQ
jgi:hypothetical protein